HIMQINSQKEALFDLRQKITETETMRKMELDNGFQALKTAMQSWEENYLIKTPISGTVNFMGIWNKNRHVIGGEEVFVIIPNNQDTPTAKAKLPVQGAGKVKEGQAVTVRITNFPDQEFGYLKGIVSSISNTPTKDGFYVVDIRFPDGIVTNYNIALPISQQMHGSADIVTNDLRLFDRILMPMKKLLKNNEP
ncbi:MAG: HlyD family efflux transporter periplasmic adaptor subunit, partial [Tannerellaceae bacterium]